MYKRVKLIISGIFTVPATGTWRVNYSIFSKYCRFNYNTVYLYYQAQNVEEMQYWTVADTNCGFSTGGRESFFNAKKEQTFYLYTPSSGAVQQGGLTDIMFCFEYVN